MALIRTWPDGSGAHPARMADIESLLRSMTTVTALPYSATIATDASVQTYCTIVATDTNAFTISNPTNAVTGRQLTYDIKNSSGGSQGTITWDTLFKLAGAFTNAANTKRRTITFRYDGTNWVEQNRAPADI